MDELLDSSHCITLYEFLSDAFGEYEPYKYCIKFKDVWNKMCRDYWSNYWNDNPTKSVAMLTRISACSVPTNKYGNKRYIMPYDHAKKVFGKLLVDEIEANIKLKKNKVEQLNKEIDLLENFLG